MWFSSSSSPIKIRSKTFYKQLKRITQQLSTALLFAASALIVILFSSGVSIATYPKVNYQGTYDCAIVLGAAVDVSKPTPVFEARLKHGIDLYHRNIVRNLIFTGGLGDGDHLSEGETGAIYAANNGISQNKIFFEQQSKTTPQNLIEAQKVMAKNNLNTAIIVSDHFHLQRSFMVAHWLGIKAGTSATPYSRYRSWKTKFPFLLREVYFSIQFKLFHW
ncbi:protein of unknown function DUF218 [[Leptolyngbya] sp. PCC 7376]|uniref:YdcF family protein n=1 Tax=[Leptolyngbya] sp. PCC 7376 TaxID=111781 RepID=UPI00029F4DEB|nr:YdcF family protein [[Leptolyngbya] sp. PCC 7376]AFY39334.1 protein of unknown function DUF218 [[Leptolyngbya] sp. PCC 7376]